MPTVVFVINPSLVGDRRGFTRRCRDAAVADGWRPRFLETTGGDGDVDLVAAAIEAGARLVVAAGGDGTVRACARATARSGVPLAIVPLGTANLVAQALGVPDDVDASLSVGLRGRDRRIDLGEADGAPYAAMAGIGLDAAVVAATRGPVKRLGWLGYAVAGLPHLRGRSHEFTIRLDGGEPLVRAARCVVVGNVGLLPGGFALLQGARVDDGVLDVGVLTASHLVDWVHLAHGMLTGGGHDGHLLDEHQARRVEITADVPLLRQADGELLPPASSLVVTVHPRTLLVRVPPGDVGRPTLGALPRTRSPGSRRAGNSRRWTGLHGA